MVQSSEGGDRRGSFPAAAITVALILVGVLALTLGFRGTTGPPQPVAAEPVTSVTAAAPSSPAARPKPASSASPAQPRRPAPTTTTRTPSAAATESPATRIQKFLPASAPAVLDIPSIGVHSSHFVDLQVAQDGILDVPGTADEVGFYADGPTPGQLGPAVIGAHVDSTKGPGVFYNLGALKVGAKIHVTRQDKFRTSFVVDKVKVYPKDEFPTDEVYYGDFDQAEIRLVTCGGPFDRVKHYLGNVVVFGHLTSVS